MPKANFPTARRVSPVYVIDEALYTRTTSAAAMADPDAIRARVTGSDGITRVGWFVAALECAPDEETEIASEAEQQAPKIAATG